MSRSNGRRLSLAIVTALMATLALSATAFADPSTGTVAGHLTDGGNAMPDVPVGIYDLNFSPVATTVTDWTGAFSFTDLAPGSYKVAFNLPGFLQQFVHQKLGFDEADPVTVNAGETTTVDEAVLPHGALRGRVTNTDGTAFFAPYVNARTDDGLIFAQANGDADGNYVLPILPAGTYRVSFSHGSGPTQFAHGRTNGADADPIVITNGVETVLDETFLPTGAVAGHLTRSGTPVPDAFVQLLGPNGTIGSSLTGPDGAFRIEAFPGEYKLQFQMGGLFQYAHGKRNEAEADTIVVAAGPDTIVDEEALPVGTIAGRLTGADGNPVVGANVAVEDGTLFLSGFTDGDGRYSVEAPAGRYWVGFGLDANGRQWAFGKSSAGAADDVTVVENQTTVVDDTLRPFGSITVTARDATTGAPILAFCSSVSSVFSGGCTQDGTVEYPAVLAGRYIVDVFPDAPGYLVSFVKGVIVTSGQNTSVVVNVARAATIQTTVRDARTGAPVANICVDAVPPLAPAGLGSGGEQCSDETGAVTVTNLKAGTYNLFAWARDGVHGHQWVGPSGGTGAQAKARLVTVRAGETVAVPPIKVDRPGAISGVITDAATGAGLRNAAAGLTSYSDGFGGTAAQAFTDDTGHYTFPDLGPYAWTFFFREYNHAAEFSGGTPNKLLATGIKVKAGQTTTYNVGLRAGTRLSVKVVGPQGQPVDFARITVVNALAGEDMASADCAGTQNCVSPVLGPQLVKLTYVGYVHGEQYIGYVGGADFLHASVFLVPGSGTKQLTVRMTQLDP